MKRQQFVYCPAMVGDPSRHGRRRHARLAETLVWCAEVIHRPDQIHPVLQGQRVARQRSASPGQGG
jgi:hypothetical protein